MATTNVIKRAPVMGESTKLKFATLDIDSTADTTVTLTPASFGLGSIRMLSAYNRTSIAAIKIVPTYDGAGNITQAVLSWTTNTDDFVVHAIGE